MRPVRIMPASSRTWPGSLAARRRDSAGASSASPSSRARGSCGLMRATEWRSLPSARSRGARPLCTQSRISGTIVCRNESESAACTRSASGQPPSSCTRTSPATASVRSSPAPRSRSPVVTMSAHRSWCQRLYSGESQSRAESQPAAPSGYARSMSCVAAAICNASDAPGSSSSTQSSVRSRCRACGCTSATHSCARSSSSVIQW
jgi:hypothetical protein